MASRIWCVDITMVGAARARGGQQFLQHGDGAIVERSERFVEQQQIGIVQKCARHGQPLAHAARKFPRQAFFHADQAHPFQCLVGGFFGIGDAHQLAEERQVFKR